jgi:mono/diheme cytochrome c family protein
LSVRKTLFLLPLYLLGDSDFITDLEYGEMLYNNPRGVSCASCHGYSGEGKDIVGYLGKDDKIITIRGVDIRHKEFKELKKILARNHPIMPKYYLTDEEIKAIYDYLASKR